MVQAQSPDLAERRAAIAAAEGATRQAGLWPNPTLDLEQGDTRLDPFDGSTGKAMATIGQPLPIGGRVGKARTAARLQSEVRRWDYAVAEHRLFFDAHAVWIELLWLSESGRLVGDAMARLDHVGEHLEKAKAAPLDQQRVALERALVEQELVLIATQGTLARERLRALMGGDPPKLSPLDGTLEDALVPSETAIENLPSVRAHFEYRRAEADVAWAQARVAEARAGAWPDVTVRAGIGTDRNDDAALGLVGLSVPIPIFDRAQGTIDERRAEVAMAQARLDATEQCLLGDLRSLLALLNELDTLVAAYRDGHAVKARENYDAAVAALDDGTGDVTTVLDAERALYQTLRAELAYRRDLTRTLWQFRHFLSAVPPEE